MTGIPRESPLAATLQRLDAADEWRAWSVGPPADDGWVSVADLRDGDVLRSWFDELVEIETAGHRDVAASYVAGWLGSIVLEGPMHALRTELRTWHARADSLLVHRHAEGWIDGIAVLDDLVRVLPDDPDAGAPGTEIVADAAIMRRDLATEAAELLTPMFELLRSWAPFGLAGMWGTTADEIAGTAVWAARRAGHDCDEAFRAAGELLDELATRAPRLRVRPTLVEVPWSKGTASLARKGTCCLWYKTQTEPDPSGEGYCSSCPLREPTSQVERWSRWLEEEATAT